MAFYAPQHRAYETFRRRWCMGRADLQNLCYQGRISWYPIAHNNPSTWFCNTNHFPGYIKWLRCEHGAKNTYNQIEPAIFQFVQISCIAFLDNTIGEPFF